MIGCRAAGLVHGALLMASLVGLAACSGPQPAAGPRASEDTLQLFRDRCALCHGIDGRGTPLSRGAADFNDADWRDTTRVEDLIVVITEGRGEMRGFLEVLTPEEIAEVAAGLKSGSGLFENR